MSKLIIKEKLTNLCKEDLVDLLFVFLEKHEDLEEILLKELPKRLEHSKSKDLKESSSKEFYDNFSRVCEILGEHNELGGGPEEEENEAYDGLEAIVKLFKEKKLGADLKQEFIDSMFEYYDWDNSGLSDQILDAVYEICESNKDWLYVIDKLGAKDTGFRKGLIMDIYRDKLRKKMINCKK